MCEPREIDASLLDEGDEAISATIGGITTEQKFQHFLNATVRNGSVYRIGSPAWTYDEDH